ncbi:unnamed protein product [Auanema sp. JU1783]|nr:unnamed protein product [Auanema sp. JU1783]
MVRKLKLHEQKLLRKTDFVQWEVDQFGKQNDMLRRFHIQKREQYSMYNKLASEARAIAEQLKELPLNDPFRNKCVKAMLSKFYAVGLIPTADSAERLGKVSGASFARRRLPVVMKNSGMVDSIKTASDFVEQGHVRVGHKLITDPAFVVTRAQEDAITWTNASKIRQHVAEYNNNRDDYELA